MLSLCEDDRDGTIIYLEHFLVPAAAPARLLANGQRVKDVYKYKMMLDDFSSSTSLSFLYI